ncbi:MAG: pyruvate kinase [Prolixibacteraceae bacterium]|nr:pyruvate kinase [Prolixibacteraceae bacterium]MBN2650553.1 pyruvate kinase [Prolixibacteraceae bacterium]
MKKTKIVATISDWKSCPEYIQSLYDNGMNVVRMNTAHINREGATKIMNDVRAVSNKIALLIDTKGPEVRITNLEEGLAVDYGDKVKVSGNLKLHDCLHVNYPYFVNDIHIGAKLLVDDGEIELEVKDKDNDYLYTEVTNSGIIKNRKSINVPGVSIKLPSLTEKDKDFILFAIENNIEFIAHSFVRNKHDVLDIQKILDEHNSPIKIIAKIENQEGVDKIDEILDYAYGVMIARGDLGIEIPAEKIPSVARMLIKKCIARKRPVIMATQMLHSMIENPRPTRAEVSDIANAVYNRCDAIMLSGETAYGKYGIEAVKIMSKVAAEVEKNKDKRNDIVPPINFDISSFLAAKAIEAANEMNTTAIVTDTLSGHNARHISAFRGEMPVYAKCYRPRVMRELALSYGIFASPIQAHSNRDETIQTSLQDLVDQNCISTDDTIVYVGSSYGIRGKASFLEVINVKTGLSPKTEEDINNLVGPKDK